MGTRTNDLRLHEHLLITTRGLRSRAYFKEFRLTRGPRLGLLVSTQDIKRSSPHGNTVGFPRLVPRY